MKNRGFSKYFVILLSMIFITGISICAFAGSVDIPNTFTAGDTAKAGQVNDNFSTLEAAVDDNDNRITTNGTTIADHESKITALEALISSLKTRDYTFVYTESFSLDPGWTTDQSANHYWDNASQSYYVKAENDWPGYTPSRYFYNQISWNFDTFELKWDIKITRADWSAGIDFGLLDSNLIGAGGGGGEGLYVNFGNADGGNALGLYVRGSGGGAVDSVAGDAFSENVWYKVTLAYDKPSNTVSLDIINRDTLASVWSTSLSVPGGGFSAPLNYLGGSRSGVGDGGVYGGVNQWAVAEGNIDNVKLSKFVDLTP